MNTVSHMHPGQWARPGSRQLEFNSLDPWVDLAKLLERGKFDAIFLADVVGTHDIYRGSRDTSVQEGMQIPVNDPALIIPAMAYATENLGFAVTSSVIQEHPFTFARKISTLDHLTNGRIGWNVVTSFLESAARNLGFGTLPPHAERYARADEYVEVVYKLLEGSWEDDAVLRDVVSRKYADPSKVHEINHVGQFFQVVGPHLCEPSRQRMPVLFQAGSSAPGRDFGARHAEGAFIAARLPEAARVQIADMKERAATFGRRADDLIFYAAMSFIVGGTEEEAQRKAREIDEYASDEGYAAVMSGAMGVDLGAYPLDTPVGDMEQYSLQGVVKSMVDSIPDKSWTFGDVLRYLHEQRIVGTPEQVADALQEWVDAGVHGINIRCHSLPGSLEDFVDGVTPVLQERGLQQREYASGTLREKLFDGAAGPRLNDRHPAASRRRPSSMLS
ncbi:MAG: LLM class flavin-dependent oxidoreductase [Actinomycetota bacterium]|nr:LLM class flavin-dependent oxidoreductase [Actinomycetota bacterium]